MRANYKNGADLFLTRFRAVSSAVELAGEPAGSVYRKNLERTEGDLSRVLAALLCQVPSSDIRRSRSYDTFDSHIEEFLTLRRHEAPNLPQLVQHSRSLSADLAEMVALSSNGTLEDSLYPKTKADKRFMMRWLSNSLASIALDLVYDEILESAGPVTIVNMGRRIESFVQEDAMTPDGEYRGFMATLLMSTVFEYSPTRPRALREMIKSHLKANFRSLARRVAPALTPAKTAALPQSSMPATIPAALVKSRVPNTDALFAQNMRMPQTKKATHYKAETVEPNVADDLDPFISGEAGLDKLEAEKPYKVFFRRQNPFFSGPQTVVFSHLLLRDFQGHNDARSVRATDWLEAIQQGIARRWERGIKRLKSDEFSWEVKIDGTVFRILGNRVGNQSWFFQEFRAK